MEGVRRHSEEEESFIPEGTPISTNLRGEDNYGGDVDQDFSDNLESDTEQQMLLGGGSSPLDIEVDVIEDRIESQGGERRVARVTRRRGGRRRRRRQRNGVRTVFRGNRPLLVLATSDSDHPTKNVGLSRKLVKRIRSRSRSRSRRRDLQII